LPALVAVRGQLALLGAGEKDIEHGFREAVHVYPGSVGAAFGYDENLAHLIQGGADALVMPSRFEPCGLTQLCALRYGAVPIVSRVGGLADTIIDANEMALDAGAGTGLQFAPVTLDALVAAIRRAATIFGTPAWQRIQANAMATDVSWRRPARRYAELFAALTGEHLTGPTEKETTILPRIVSDDAVFRSAARYIRAAQEGSGFPAAEIRGELRAVDLRQHRRHPGFDARRRR
jgi:starch synthase